MPTTSTGPPVTERGPECQTRGQLASLAIASQATKKIRPPQTSSKQLLGIELILQGVRW